MLDPDPFVGKLRETAFAGNLDGPVEIRREEHVDFDDESIQLKTFKIPPHQSSARHHAQVSRGGE